MSLTLLLVRHAQAQEKFPDETDRERILTNVGIQQGMKLGKFLQTESKIPDIIVSSVASRAMTTAELIGEQVGISVDDIVKNVTLYQASVRIFLKAINVLPDNWKCVAMVGHNPTILYLAEYLTGGEIDSLEPGGMVEVSFPFDSWEMVSEKTGAIELTRSSENP